jgi:hypothetical protein
MISWAMDFYLGVYIKATFLVVNVGLKPHLNIQIV